MHTAAHIPFGKFKQLHKRTKAGDDPRASKEHQLDVKSPREFQRIQAEFEQAAAVTVATRPACPAHELQRILKPTQGKLCRIWNAFVQMLVALVFVLFPPWPPRIFRKVMFRAPPRGHYYHLIYGQGEERRVAFTAREVVDKPDVRLCLPMLLEKKVDAVDVYYHLLRSKVSILNVEDNVNICAVHLRCELSRLRLPEEGRSPYLMIFSQPNSSDLGSCLLMEPNFADMADFLRCDMLFFDYPGYGVSDGQPSEYLIYRSMECIMEYAKTLGYEEQNVILIGFSLGTAAAVHLASISPNLGALVLMAPFTSFLRVGFNTPGLVKSFGFDMFRSIDKAAAIKCPTLVCHGTNDVMVKHTHGEAMAAEIEGAEIYLVDKATHQGLLCQRKMWDKVEYFLESKLDMTSKWRALINGMKSAEKAKMRSKEATTPKEKQEEKKDSKPSRSATKSAETVGKTSVSIGLTPTSTSKQSTEKAAKKKGKDANQVNRSRSKEKVEDGNGKAGKNTPISSKTRSPAPKST